MDAKFKGRAWCFGDNVDTGTIASARFITGPDNSKLGKSCLIDLRPEFPEQVKPEDILIGGRNFGCGSSREHAPLAIQQCLSCVVADSFARIFYRNAINRGLYLAELPNATELIGEGDTVEIDFNAGKVYNRTRDTEHAIQPMPPFMQQIYEVGGLYEYIKQKVEQKKRDADK